MSEERRVYLITGGASGIGKYLVEYFTTKGEKVVFCDVNKEGGEKVAESTGAVFFHCDITSETKLIELLELAYSLHGQVDVVINNAGLSKFKPLLEQTTEEWDYLLNTNLRSAFILTREYARRHDKQRKGFIINISSTRAYQSEVNSEAYAASKGGLVSLTHATALTLSDFNIKVNCIAPGWINTLDPSMLSENDHAQHPSKRVGVPHDIALACSYLSDPSNDFVNGQTLVVDGGMTKKMIYL